MNKISWDTFQGTYHTRELARIRDNHTCQDCGKKWKEGERRFDIHHLNGMCGRKSKGYDRKEDLYLLITLCHKCHFARDDHSLFNLFSKQKKEREVRVNEMRKLRIKRWTLQEIGDKYGITYQRVQYLLCG